ncbi:MAG TPA: alpha/beta hydrolase [Candidatus Binataceae bacterium]|nr:alpha/beta hydrolase [Candidatus Binataceae bacterium]
MASSTWPQGRSVALAPRANQGAINLVVHEQGEGPAVIFCHGFPELAYSWRHQLPAVAAAGFRAIAPDQRGYGDSSAPAAVTDYGLTELTGDLVGLLDSLKIDRAIFVGHDWGGFVAWAMPVLYPERTAGVIGVCTPYMAMPQTSFMRALVNNKEERFYILWFQEPGRAESVMDPKARLIFDRLMRAPADIAEATRRMNASGELDMNPFRRIEDLQPETPLIVTAEELDHYVKVYEKTGFRGGINWYRNIDRNSREHPEVGTKKLELPCLMITAAWDVALRPQMAAGMPALCSDLEMRNIERAGHWVQQEFPNEVNTLIVDWLKKRFSK